MSPRLSYHSQVCSVGDRILTHDRMVQITALVILSLPLGPSVLSGGAEWLQTGGKCPAENSSCTGSSQPVYTGITSTRATCSPTSLHTGAKQRLGARLLNSTNSQLVSGPLGTRASWCKLEHSLGSSKLYLGLGCGRLREL